MEREFENINEALMHFVMYHQPEKVKELLSKGADPNYHKIWDDPSNALNQPDTPLRMVMFCISDNLLEDEDLRNHAKVAKILLAHGADPKPAIEIAESRYGKYSPEYHDEGNLFMDVYRIVAKAK